MQCNSSEVKDVTVIIVNYNTAHLIQSCIDTVLEQQGVEKEIMVVDNASHDNSVAVISAYGDAVKLIANQENRGFGCANNQAALLARGKFLFLLNPDAVFQDTMALKQMLDFMQAEARVGLAGTQVARKKGGYSIPQQFYPGQRYTQVSYAKLPGNIAWVIGASMMIRRDVFEAVKGFDEDFFLYGEEADLCLRIRKQGYEIGYNPLVMVNHVGGGSEQQTAATDLWQKKQKGLYLFIKKNYPPAEAVKVIEVYLRRAKRKLFFLSIQKMIGIFDEKKKNNYERYQTIVSTSKQFLFEFEKEKIF